MLRGSNTLQLAAGYSTFASNESGGCLWRGFDLVKVDSDQQIKVCFQYYLELHEKTKNGKISNSKKDMVTEIVDMRRDAMNVEVNDEFKFATVWLTNEEKKDPRIRDFLKPVITEYQQKKYKFVIMESGEKDLLDLTKALLSHNKNLAANGS